MNYEERYKKAIYLLKELRPKISDYYREKLDGLFPEITESKDESIRKELMDFVIGNSIGNSEKCEKYLAWLEKQGLQNLANSAKICKDEPKFKARDWVINGKREVAHIAEVRKDSYGALRYYIEWENGNKSDPMPCFVDDDFHLWKIDDAKEGDVLYMNNGMSECIFIYESFDHGIIYKHASYNKFGFEGESYLVLNDGYILPATREQCDLLFQKMKEAGYEWDADKKNIKKQDEPKDFNSIDPHFGKPIETDPKFKVGDWIAANRANFRSPIKIVGISNTEYRTEDTKGNSGVSYIDYLDSRFHPWSIADAKDGDILISACNHPFIYNGNSDASLVGGYGGIATACGFKPSAEKCHWTENINIHPATKEEQDYLFKKMAKAGYMWDSYTKSVFCSTDIESK